MALLLVIISLHPTSYLTFPWVPCTPNNKAISAYLSQPMFVLEEQWLETLERQKPSGLIESTPVGPLTENDIVKWATSPPIKATTIFHT